MARYIELLLFLTMGKRVFPRISHFDIGIDLNVSNNNTKSTHFIATSAIDCARHCNRRLDCLAATYHDKTSGCVVHSPGSYQPLVTETKAGYSTLTNKGTVAVAMEFDIDTLHSELFVSADKRVLSNFPSDGVMMWPAGSNQLTTYKGVISNVCVAPGKKFYYEFSYEYLLLKTFISTEIVIEFGVADKATVDKSHFVGMLNVDGWSFPINNCLSTKICIEAWRALSGYFETPISENVVGTYKTGQWAVLLDRTVHTLSLFDMETSSLIYSFTGVYSAADLCPVFSFRHSSNASFTILNSYALN